jgi:DNA-binding NarL/FixJ family response regulator
LKLKTSSATVAAIRKDMDKPELLKDSKDLETRVIELYNKGKTIKEISDECDIGTTTVNKIISKSGIKRVSKSERSRAEIMELHGQGKTQAQICEQTGFCRSIVSKIINSNPDT